MRGLTSMPESAGNTRKSLSPDHPSVATSLNNLAELYCFQEKYEEALPLFQRALTILEKAYGSNHRDVATVLSHMANLFHAPK